MVNALGLICSPSQPIKMNVARTIRMMDKTFILFSFYVEGYPPAVDFDNRNKRMVNMTIHAMSKSPPGMASAIAMF